MNKSITTSVRNCAGPVARNYQVLLRAISFRKCIARLAIWYSGSWLNAKKNIVQQPVKILETFYNWENFTEFLLPGDNVLNANMLWFLIKREENIVRQPVKILETF